VISLEKGKSLSLDKGLSKVIAVMKWDAPDKIGSVDYDLDITAFLCNNKSGNPVCETEGNFIFYNQLKSPNNEVVHSEDARNGGEEDVIVDFHGVNKMTPAVNEIMFFVTLHKAAERGQTMKSMKSASLRIEDASNSTVIAEFQLKDQYPNDIAIQVGSFVKSGDDWSFQTVGNGFNQDLGAIARKLGLHI
jgi:tellurium resistance protein TerD